MQYVTITRRSFVQNRKEDAPRLEKVFARVSTRANDYHAPLRTFTANAFNSLMARAQVMVRHNVAGARFVQASRT